MIPLVFYYFAQLTNWDMKKIFICWSPVSLSETELRCTVCNAVWGGIWCNGWSNQQREKWKLIWREESWNFPVEYNINFNWMSLSDIIITNAHIIRLNCWCSNKGQAASLFPIHYNKPYWAVIGFVLDIAIRNTRRE